MEFGGVSGRIDVREVRIGHRRHVRREHGTLFEGAADEDVLRILFLAFDEFGDRVLEEAGRHARRTDGPDLLLVAHENRGGLGRHLVRGVQKRLQPRERAHAVVVPVPGDQRAVEPHFARHSSRHDLQFRAEKVLFRHIVGCLQIGDETRFVRFGLPVLRRRRPREDVQILGREEFVARLLRLVVAEVRQNVADHEHRIARLVPDLDLDLRAVLAHDGPVERERQDEPLVLLDPAVDVAVEIDVPALLVERFRLEVEPRRVRMAAHDLESGRRERFAPDDRREKRAVLVAPVDLVAGLERFERIQFLEARLAQKADAFGVAPALGLGDAEIAHVPGAVVLKRTIDILFVHRQFSFLNGFF